jgi:hypothetical protein
MSYVLCCNVQRRSRYCIGTLLYLNLRINVLPGILYDCPHSVPVITHTPGKCVPVARDQSAPF